MGGNAAAAATAGAGELAFVDDCTLSALLLMVVAVVEIVALPLVWLLPNDVGEFFATGGNARVTSDDGDENDDGIDDENGVLVVVLLSFAESVFGKANDAAENENIPAPPVLPLLRVVAFDPVVVEETPKLVGGPKDGAPDGVLVS